MSQIQTPEEPEIKNESEDESSTDSDDSKSDSDDSKTDSNDLETDSNDSETDSAVSDGSEEVSLQDPKIKAILAELDNEENHVPTEDLPQSKPNRRQKIKTILREYAQLSSTHGVDHMGEAHTARVIMFWSFMLLMCAVAFAYLFSDTIIRFLKFEVVVQISMKNEARMFPAVTVCNLNPYKRSELMNVPELAALVQAFEVAIGNV